ncbi:OmpA family protein [Thiohalomonas denitrificans]|uniref:OmpA family protein n=1 Tax=Thiohalomonas denitrificans TaxID=415747 RepID=UPI0026EAA771|nr:OmpA family protein [Thiohalomonas denitrificans]
MKRVLLVSVIVAGLAGCAAPGPRDDSQSQTNRTAAGAVIGAIGGAVLGHQMDSKRGAVAGAIVGGATGAAVGNYMDKQEQAFEDALAEEQRQNQIEVQRVRDDLLKLTLDSEVSFDFDSAAIKSSFKPSLNKLMNVLAKYDRTDVTVVGHTDSVGSEAYNQRLSERRASAVGDYLIDQGISRYRLRTEGSGESEPRASNNTAAGRQLNRRVEVFVRPEAEFAER